MKLFENLIDYSFVSSFDIGLLRENLVIPIENNGIYIKCFICEESNLNNLKLSSIIEEVFLSKNEIEFFLSDIDTRISFFNYSEELVKIADVNPILVKEFFSKFLNKALALRSSDIHFETLKESMSIRFRIDGELKLFYIFNKAFFSILSSYIKMLSKLDVTIIRNPQDGRFSFNTMDFRVSTMPTINGESIVIRVLDNLDIAKDFTSLGFSSHILKDLKNILTLKEGLVLITGPTGSGKSTTLYSIIKELNSEDKKIITVEDPVEYKIEQVQQVNVNESLNLDFQTILRNILRQDPDVILIGEIRDSYSLKIALQASLTGHLVLASIHANSSIDTVSRLLDLNADNYLLASTLKYIISQRLILKVCEHCKGAACEKCNYKGFYGRTNIAESLKIDEVIKKILVEKKSTIHIKEYLENKNYKTILDDGLAKVSLGLSTEKELFKVVSL